MGIAHTGFLAVASVVLLCYVVGWILKKCQRLDWVVVLPILDRGGADVRAVQHLARSVPAAHHVFLVLDSTPVYTYTYVEVARLYCEAFHAADGVAMLHIVVIGHDGVGHAHHPLLHFVSAVEFASMVRRLHVVILATAPPDGFYGALCDPHHHAPVVTPYDSLFIDDAVISEHGLSTFLVQCFEQHFRDVYRVKGAFPQIPTDDVRLWYHHIDRSMADDCVYLIAMAITCGLFNATVLSTSTTDVLSLYHYCWHDSCFEDELKEFVFGPYNPEATEEEVRGVLVDFLHCEDHGCILNRAFENKAATKLLAFQILVASPDGFPDREHCLVKLATEVCLGNSCSSQYDVQNRDNYWFRNICTRFYTVNFRGESRGR
jgi:hypothetical protein